MQCAPGTFSTVALAVHKDKPQETREFSPWEDYLAPTGIEATQQVVQELIKLFAKAPNLPALRATAEEIPSYKGIPLTPPARPHPNDKALAAVQDKLRTAMFCFVHAGQEGDKADRYTGAAFIW